MEPFLGLHRPTPRSAELLSHPQPQLLHLSPLPFGSWPPLLVPGSRRPTPYILASSAVTSGALPAPPPQLIPCLHPPRPFPDLPYLFVRCVSECIRLAPALPSLRACPSCFRADRAPTRLRMFASVSSLSGPVFPHHSDSGHQPRGQRGLYIGTLCGVPPRPPRGGGLYICNIQSIVKNLFKAPQGRLHGRACGSGARRGPPAGPTSTFYLCMGLISTNCH